MTVVRWQGLIFCLAGLLSLPLQQLIGRQDIQTELIGVFILIVILGVPHGALDVIFAQRVHKVRTFAEWALFGLVYIAPVLAIIAIWYWIPLVFLVGFLAISALHFSGDLEPESPFLVRVFYGGLPVIFPILFYSAEVEVLFQILTDPLTGTSVVNVLRHLALPWSIGLTVAIFIQSKSDRFAALEITVVAIVTSLLPPLIGFALFFCGMHSARHILRTAAYFPDIEPTFMFKATIWPMVMTLSMAGLGWYLLKEATVSEQIMRVLFVGLAAVTVPHMLLIDMAGRGKKPL